MKIFRPRASYARRPLAEFAQLQNCGPRRSLHIKTIIDVKILLVFDARGIPSAITVGLTVRAGKQWWGVQLLQQAYARTVQHDPGLPIA
jgi:hypothetical protein